jgi:hypothetical protein
MMPYDSYRLYQTERAKSPAEIRRADEQAGRLASAVSSLFGTGRSRKHAACGQLMSGETDASVRERFRCDSPQQQSASETDCPAPWTGVRPATSRI